MVQSSASIINAGTKDATGEWQNPTPGSTVCGRGRAHLASGGGWVAVRAGWVAVGAGSVHLQVIRVHLGSADSPGGALPADHAREVMGQAGLQSRLAAGAAWPFLAVPLGAAWRLDAGPRFRLRHPVVGPSADVIRDARNLRDAARTHFGNGWRVCNGRVLRTDRRFRRLSLTQAPADRFNKHAEKPLSSNAEARTGKRLVPRFPTLQHRECWISLEQAMIGAHIGMVQRVPVRG